MSSNYFLIEFLHLARAVIMEHFHEGNTPISALVNSLNREDLYLLLFSFGILKQCHNGEIPSEQCSIKAPALFMCLMEICHQYKYFHISLSLQKLQQLILGKYFDTIDFTLHHLINYI